jgi:hypothetical protein
MALKVQKRPIDLAGTNGWPWALPPTNTVATNYFSARWAGFLLLRTEGTHTLYVSADAGAAFRLSFGVASGIDNWDNPDPNPVELSCDPYLFTDNDCPLVLEYANFGAPPRIRLSWTEPGSTNKVVIPLDRLAQLGIGPTGMAVDADGKIWAANNQSDNVMRIDPKAGDLITTNGVTTRAGVVDMVVDLGDGSFHPRPYGLPANPYNYSDMTGFNNRVVNPGLQPLKGYWTVISDSGVSGEVWNRVSWDPFIPNGCTAEVFVRAADDTHPLANAVFAPVTNGVPLVGVQGRYIEVRAALTRDDATKQPILYELRLYGVSPF